MDFYDISVVQDSRTSKNLKFTILPVFKFSRGSDLICKGGELYAYWHDNQWKTSPRELVEIIDSDILKKRNQILDIHPGAEISMKLMDNHTSHVMKEFAQYTKLVQQSDAQFNTRIIFADEIPNRDDFSTNQLFYTPLEGPTPAFDKMFGKLYEQEELEKILWFIGALLTNSMGDIQKFMYLYGPKGSGKGTVIKLIEQLFDGYYSYISLARLTSGSEFATSQIRELPLLIDTDSKINKIQDDTNLLKLTSHEGLTVNIKHKQMYDVIFKGLLVTASNQRYQVNNIDSGITRRAVVVHPSKNTHDGQTYRILMEQMKFEIPHIAQKAINLFEKRGMYYYDEYVDTDMAEATDHVFAFVRQNYRQLGDPVSLKKASELYKVYLEDIGFEIRGYKRKIKEELKRYYDKFDEQYRIGEEVCTNVYRGFKYHMVFPNQVNTKQAYDDTIDMLESKLGLHNGKSIFDTIAKTYPAQYTNDRGNPMYKWDNVDTTLSDLNTRQLHFVRVPLNHIVIDLDLKEDGEKSLRLNLEKALEFPETYTELSKSGSGVHLHYIYEGDPSVLEKLYSEDVEIKVFSGKSSLRRCLSKCNSKEIAHISTGLPEKERDKIKMYKEVEIIVWNEKKMRTVVENNLRKIYHPNTKPSMDFIFDVFKKAKEQGVKYDLRDMRQDILIFAGSSTNQADACLKMANTIEYTSFDDDTVRQLEAGTEIIPNEDLYFYDIEVFPNLFVVVYKRYGEDKFHKLINPTSAEIENLIKKPLVGFNNRRYDNHILYGVLLGGTNADLFRQSQRIINKAGGTGAFYNGAYELSYVDIYEYSSNKQSLKKWEVDLDLRYDELNLPWDQPVPEDLWERVAEYCCNDVEATEAVFNATRADYNARCIIAQLSGLSVNSKTQSHAEAFLTDGNNDLKANLEYTDLSEIFEGYKFGFGKSEYRGINPSEGGYVYSKPGIHRNVGLFDVVSMHPNSAVNLNYFGKYTERLRQLIRARVAVKEHNFDEAATYFNGALKPYLTEETYKDLAFALKIIINIIYGMTSAPYPTNFKHESNIDNIIAKRGALFMIDLQLMMEQEGYDVVHIKTDSIKIADYDERAVDLIMSFGKKYGYEFDFEAIYDTFCLVNKAVYIAKDVKDSKTHEVIKPFEPVGKMFAEPYTFKTMFSKEELKNDDFAIVKQVQNASIYLDDHFVGRLAEVYSSLTGYNMWRVVSEEKVGAVVGTKNHGWRLYSDFKGYEDIDMKYYHDEINKAYEAISKVGDPKLITDYEPVV